MQAHAGAKGNAARKNIVSPIPEQYDAANDVEAMAAAASAVMTCLPLQKQRVRRTDNRTFVVCRRPKQTPTYEAHSKVACATNRAVL